LITEDEYFLADDIARSLRRALRARNVPFVFTTGYDRRSIDAEFQDVLVWEKPFDVLAMAQALASMVRHV